MLVSAPGSTGWVTPPVSHRLAGRRRIPLLFDEAAGLSNAPILTPYKGVQVVAAHLFGAVADTVHHLALHDEMRDIERRVADGAAAAAHQKPCPSVLFTQVETPASAGLGPALHPLEIVGRHQQYMRIRLDRC